jgi:peptidoglycan hydrolase-like protein with peptidoglycan-binding domain
VGEIRQRREPTKATAPPQPTWVRMNNVSGETGRASVGPSAGWLELPASVLDLQRLAGNSAVAAIVSRQPSAPAAPPPPTAPPSGQPKKMLRFGSDGPEVGELQTDLNKLGADPQLEITEHFRSGTRTAVINFQKEKGFRQDGIVGPMTHGAIDRLLGRPVEPAPGPDLVQGTQRPDATQLDEIRKHLNPTSAGKTGKQEPWDGAGTDDAAKANRAALIAELTAALEAHLALKMPFMKKRSTAPKMAMQDFEGAGKQAKRLVDERFGNFASAGVLTRAQERDRAAFGFTAGVNLLDSSDPKVRPPNAADQASWMAETDDAASTVQKNHHLDQARSPAEKAFLEQQVLAPFSKGHKADLELYDQFGFALAFQGPTRVLIQPGVDDTPAFPNVKPNPDEPSPAERRKRWHEWQILTHEYIHTLEHPGFGAAHKGRRVMFEGFCEMFTKEVLEAAIPTAKADSDAALRGGVEGLNSSGQLFSNFDPKLVPDYDAGEYKGYMDNAEGVRTALGASGEEAVRAAFFMGHVELIGLKPNGKEEAPPAPGFGEQVTVPRGYTSVFSISILTGVPEGTILAANPGVPPKGPLPATMQVPGVRKHRVVAASDESGAKRVETREIIALQNGVSEAALQRANPGAQFAALRSGQELLIPARP